MRTLAKADVVHPGGAHCAENRVKVAAVRPPVVQQIAVCAEVGLHDGDTAGIQRGGCQHARRGPVTSAKLDHGVGWCDESVDHHPFPSTGRTQHEATTGEQEEREEGRGWRGSAHAGFERQ